MARTRTAARTPQHVPLGSLTQPGARAGASCRACGSERVTRIAMSLTDGSPVEFTSSHRCEHRTSAEQGFRPCAACGARPGQGPQGLTGGTPPRHWRQRSRQPRSSQPPGRPAPSTDWPPGGRSAAARLCARPAARLRGPRRLVEAYDVRGLVPDQLDAGSPDAWEQLSSGLSNRPAASSWAATCGPPRRTLSPPSLRGPTRRASTCWTSGWPPPTSCTTRAGASTRPGAMFTASHDPARYNGIKLCRLRRPARRPGHRAGRGA